LLISSLVYGQLPKTGLYFNAHSYDIDQRTSLILNEGKPYMLDKQDDLTMEFDVFLRNEKIKFGYIFRIISNTDENFDFIVNNRLDAFFVVNMRDFHLKSVLTPEQWIHVAVSFSKKRDSITLQLNDETVECPYGLKDIKWLNISFGRCYFQNFPTNDIAPFILKNIRINRNNKELHHWDLDQHGENSVYDEMKNVPAVVHNPQWMMDARVHWKKIAEFQSAGFPQIAFDPVLSNIYILKPEELICYSLLTGLEQRLKSKPEIQGKFYNHLMYDPVFSRLLFYSIEKQRNYFYDPAENRWTDYQPDENEPTHAHQNRYISVGDSSLYLFGGYGFYKYNSDFFKIDLKTGNYSRHDFSHVIMPRYLAAMGGTAAGDKIYILGGHGAEMGRQELSPKNFSDLFEIDLKTLETKYLFDTDRNGGRENVYSNSLTVDEENRNLYVLAYPNKTYASSISLKKINLETQETESLADSIQFYFQDITSFCDLYYSRQLSKLIAVASYSKDRKTSDINIYTLDYPPMKMQDVIQHKAIPNENRLFYILAAILLLASVSWISGKKIIKHRKNKKLPREKNKKTPDAENTQKETLFSNAENKSILFLGGFRVFNCEGKNITKEFTPTMKYILVLITLCSLKDNRGISSAKLQELFWFDKTEESARNNRNVNIRKLRVLLQELGKIDITNQNGYWTIALPDDVFSDYKETLKLVKKIQKGAVTKEEDILKILELLNYGSLLPNIQFEWIDGFKTDFANDAIYALMNVVNNTKNSFFNDLDIRLRIADALLKLDSINEDAIRIKCKTLAGIGKMGLAKSAFDNFSKEYRTMLGEPYQGSIKDFIE
jgi:DNA-binding SARP family transcriptional activator